MFLCIRHIQFLYDSERVARTEHEERKREREHGGERKKELEEHWEYRIEDTKGGERAAGGGEKGTAL